MSVHPLLFHYRLHPPLMAFNGTRGAQHGELPHVEKVGTDDPLLCASSPLVLLGGVGGVGV